MPIKNQYKQEFSKRDNGFLISKGNLKVLELIPLMMTYPIFRSRLRKLVFDFFWYVESKGRIK